MDRWNRTHAHTLDLVATPDPGVQVCATKEFGWTAGLDDG